MDFDGFNVLIDGLGDGEMNTASEVRIILRNLLQSIFLPGDIKMVICTQEELISDYTASGVGKGKRAGWAQCNGLEGRPDMNGRVPLGRSDTYSALGNIGGSSKVTLNKSDIPPLDLVAPVSNADNGGGTKKYIMATDTEAAGNKTYENAVNSGGATTQVSIMQPYTIVLYLIKL